MVIEGALEGELDDHLSYARHDPAGRNGGNSRYGCRAKTVITEGRPDGNQACRGTGNTASTRKYSPGGSGG
jgi:hypothetical protein